MMMNSNLNYAFEEQKSSNSTRRPRWIPVILFITLTVINALIYQFVRSIPLSLVLLVISLFVSMSVKVAAEWEKAVVLRMGKFHKTAGPGCFFTIPIMDTIACWVDQRVVATPFLAEKTLTKDTVPVNVDAILFWLVWDPEKAVLEVEDYKQSVAWIAQTALRDVVGRSLLSEILSGREKLDKVLQEVIDERTEPWGITVQSVDIRDVVIPAELQDAMSREAQAERDRRARILLGTAETEIAHNFAEAAKVYQDNPIALQLRSMNILYEGLKEKGGLIVTPSSVADSLNIGTMSAVYAAVAQKAEQKLEKINSEEKNEEI